MVSSTKSYNFRYVSIEAKKTPQRVFYNFNGDTTRFLKMKNNLNLLPKLVKAFPFFTFNHLLNKTVGFYSACYSVGYNRLFSQKYSFRFKNFYKNKIKFNDKNYNNVRLKTQHGLSFILHNLGLFFPLKFFYKNFKANLFTIKKKMYTFLKANEYKMHIFSGKKKSLLYKFIFFKKKNFTYTSSSYLYNFFVKESRDISSRYVTSDLIFKKNSFFFEGIKNINNFSNEITVNRVRFKPGYQRLWRNYRLALSELIKYKYTYQRQLTGYLVKFYRKLNQYYFTENENLVSKVVIYSKLVPDYSTFYIFFKNNLFFINGLKLKSSKIFLYRNDFIQIEISN